jgi:hypothetical protein
MFEAGTVVLLRQKTREKNQYFITGSKKREELAAPAVSGLFLNCLPQRQETFTPPSCG